MTVNITDLISPLSTYVTFNNLPCFDPKTELESAQFIEYDTNEWLGKANSYSCPLGPEAGCAYFLMHKKLLDTLDLNTLYPLEFGLLDEDNNVINNLVIPSLLIIKAYCITPGLLNDPDSCYIVEAVDRRWLAQDIPCDFQINVLASDPTGQYPYYTGTMDIDANGNSLPWTWDRALSNLWTINGKLGTYPGLPYLPSGLPEGYQFIGEDSYNAINTLLAKIYCALQYNPLLDTFSIVQIGSTNDNLDALEQKYTSTIGYDKFPIQSIRANIPSNIRVYFHKRLHYYGQEQTTPQGLSQWITNAWISIDVPNTFDDAKPEKSRTKIIWDGTTALADINGNITNIADLQTRAQDIANNYLLSVRSDNKRLYQTFESLVTEIVPGGRIKLVIWHLYGNREDDGIRTTIVRTHGLFSTYVAPAKPNDAILATNGNLQPPDFASHTFPEYFPQVQDVQINIGNPVGNSLYDANIVSLSPDTLTYQNYGKCWVYKNPPTNEVLKVGAIYRGKVAGTEVVNGEKRQLYDILQNCCGASQLLKITSITPQFNLTTSSLFTGLIFTYTTTTQPGQINTLDLVESPGQTILIQLPKGRIPDLNYRYIGIPIATYTTSTSTSSGAINIVNTPIYAIVPDQIRQINLVTGKSLSSTANIFDGISTVVDHDTNLTSTSLPGESCWIQCNSTNLLADSLSAQQLSITQDYTGKFSGYLNFNNSLRPLYNISPTPVNVSTPASKTIISSINRLDFDDNSFLLSKTSEGRVKVSSIVPYTVSPSGQIIFTTPLSITGPTFNFAATNEFDLTVPGISLKTTKNILNLTLPGLTIDQSATYNFTGNLNLCGNLYYCIFKLPTITIPIIPSLNLNPTAQIQQVLTTVPTQIQGITPNNPALNQNVSLLIDPTSAPITIPNNFAQSPYPILTPLGTPVVAQPNQLLSFQFIASLKLWLLTASSTPIVPPPPLVPNPPLLNVPTDLFTVDYNGSTPIQPLINLNKQTIIPANALLAGPSTGAPGTYSFRPLVTADLPVSGVNPGTYGSGTSVPSIVINSKGQITAAVVDNIPPMVGATASSSGSAGFVPAPQIADRSNFLRGDGTYAAPPSSSPLTTKGDIFTFSTTNDRLPVGPNNQILVADSTQPDGIGWKDAATWINGAGNGVGALIKIPILYSVFAAAGGATHTATITVYSGAQFNGRSVLGGAFYVATPISGGTITAGGGQSTVLNLSVNSGGNTVQLYGSIDVTTLDNPNAVRQATNNFFLNSVYDNTVRIFCTSNISGDTWNHAAAGQIIFLLWLA